MSPLIADQNPNTCTESADNTDTLDSSRYYKFENEDGTISTVDIQKAREAMRKAMEMRAKRRKQAQGSCGN